MRWLDSITDAMSMNFSELREMVRDREAWRATVRGVAELDTTEVTEHIHTHRHRHTHTHSPNICFIYVYTYMCVYIYIYACMHAQSCPTLCDLLGCCPPGSS